MDLAGLIKQLVPLRRWVLLAALVSVAAGALSAFRVSVSPPGFHERVSSSSTARTALLLDSARSVFPDLSQAVRPLSERARALSDYLGSAEVRARMARDVGLKPTELAVSGTAVYQVPRTWTESGGDQRSLEVLNEPLLYRVQFRQPPDSPFLEVIAQAPTDAQALRLVQAAVDTGRLDIESLSRERDDARANRLAPLQIATPTIVGRSGPPTIALLIVVPIVLFPSLCVLLLGLSGTVVRTRAALAAHGTRTSTSHGRA